MSEPSIYEVLGVLALLFSILALVGFFGLARILQHELDRQETTKSQNKAETHNVDCLWMDNPE